MRRVALLLPALIAGCGTSSSPTPPPTPSALTRVQAHPPAPAAPAALARVADSLAARTRLGYVSPKATARVAAAVGARPGAIRIGSRVLAPTAAPRRTVLADEAISTVQSCLGDPVAQTIIGPGRLGRDAAIGVAVAPSASGGLAVRLCGAPHFTRDLKRFARGVHARFGRRVTQTELGERALATVELPVDDRSLRLLSGGPLVDRLFTD